MSKSIEVAALIPKYVGRFSCIGGDCEDTCCSGWRIDLDRASYLEYRSSQDPVLGPLFDQHVKRNSEARHASQYGFVARLEPPCQDCPFLDEGRLCRIQSRLGEAGLSDTCATYPRSTVLFNGLHQTILQLSCPEAARLALLAEDAFDLEGGEGSVRTMSVHEVGSRCGLPVAAMDEVRIRMFQILGDRDLDLSRRLAVVGLACERLTGLLREGRQDNVAGMIQAMEELAATGAGQIPLGTPKARQEAQVRFAWMFLLSMQLSVLSPHQRRVIDQVAELELGEDGILDEEALLARVELGTARLAPALAAVPWLLDHFLLNEALRELFPWGEGDPGQHFTNLLLRFTILRVMLAGRAAAQEATLTPQELAETVQVFCRRYQNGKRIVELLPQEEGQVDWSRLSSLFRLL